MKLALEAAAGSDTFCAKRRGRPAAGLGAAHDHPGLETQQASSEGQRDVVHQSHPMALEVAFHTCHVTHLRSPRRFNASPQMSLIFSRV